MEHNTLSSHTEANEYSIRHFAKEALHDLTHFDSKLIRTLKPLLLKPGLLTLKTFSAERQNYVKPLALFVFLNFLFFIFKVKGIFHYSLDNYQNTASLQHFITEALRETHLSAALFTERFNTAMRFEEKEYLIIMVPFFALLIWLLFPSRKRYFIEHLVFALHFYSFFLLFLTVSPLLFYGTYFLFALLHINQSVLATEAATLITILPFFFLYLLAAMRRVYRQNWIATSLKALTATAGVMALIGFVYRTLLFFVVIYSVSE